MRVTRDARDVSGYGEDAVRHVTRVVSEIGPRASGSPEEARAQDYVAAQLGPLTDAVAQQAFTIRPKGFMGFIPIAATLAIASVGLFWLQPLAGLVAIVLAWSLPIIEIGFYKPYVDRLFPERTSHNVVGVRRARGERKRILMIVGHTDSAWEWRFNYWGRFWLLGVLISSGLALFVLLCAHVANLALNGLAPPSPDGPLATLGLALLATVPPLALSMGFTNFRRLSPGANDNLSGVFLNVAVARYLHDHDIRYEHTEVRFLNTGAEECGLRGAKAYARAHGEELRATETLCIAVDTFRELEFMKIYYRDMNGITKHSEAATALLADAARAVGRPLPVGIVPLGASDAAAFTQAGIPSIALVAMDPAPARYYHTRLDRPEIMNPACIEAALEILLEALDEFDARGLA